MQQTVAQLGELDGQGQARAAGLALKLSGRAQDVCQGQLFDAAKSSETVAVKLDGIRLERSRSFGAVWLGWILWQAVKLDVLCSELLPHKRERVSWCHIEYTPARPSPNYKELKRFVAAPRHRISAYKLIQHEHASGDILVFVFSKAILVPS